MKHVYFASLLLIPTHITATTNPALQLQLSQLQQNLDTIIMQSNLDPETTEELIEVINGLTTLAENGDQIEINDLQAATSLCCLLETSSSFAKQSLLLYTNPFLTSLKHSARSNALHKLIMAASKELVTDATYYTDPYTESLGYICNEWIANTLLTSIIPATNAVLSSPSAQAMHSLLIRVFSGIAAHCAWLMQKRLISTNAPALSKKIGLKRT